MQFIELTLKERGGKALYNIKHIVAVIENKQSGGTNVYDSHSNTVTQVVEDIATVKGKIFNAIRTNTTHQRPSYSQRQTTTTSMQASNSSRITPPIEENKN